MSFEIIKSNQSNPCYFPDWKIPKKFRGATVRKIAWIVGYSCFRYQNKYGRLMRSQSAFEVLEFLRPDLMGTIKLNQPYRD